MLKVINKEKLIISSAYMLKLLRKENTGKLRIKFSVSKAKSSFILLKIPFTSIKD